MNEPLSKFMKFPNGENDVDEVVDYLRVLLQIGFLNEEKPPIVSFEIKPFGDEDPDVVIANAKRILNVAWASVVNCLNISEDFR